MPIDPEALKGNPFYDDYIELFGFTATQLSEPDTSPPGSDPLLRD
jgi:hypothetical protein